MTQVAAHASFMFNLILARKIFGRVLVFIGLLFRSSFCQRTRIQKCWRSISHWPRSPAFRQLAGSLFPDPVTKVENISDLTFLSLKASNKRPLQDNGPLSQMDKRHQSFKVVLGPIPFHKYHCERNGTILGRAEVTKTESIVCNYVFKKHKYYT